MGVILPNLMRAYSHVRQHVGSRDVHMPNLLYEQQDFQHSPRWDFTETGNLIAPCKIWGLHGRDYKEWRVLECYAVWLL
jgi:hypothetical protein